MSTGVEAVEYPSSDGRPIAENTLQYRWIVTIEGGLAALFADSPDVFVAGDNLIYPVEGDPKVRTAPDIYVAFGRPKGDRGSYQVWREGGVFPQVVFEVLSPGNRRGEMRRKLAFYDDYGAEEYYVYDPDRVRLTAYTRPPGGRLAAVPDPAGFVSPRLGVRFDLSGDELVIFRPDGEPFRTFAEVEADRQRQAALAIRAAARADQEAARADEEAARAEGEKARADAEAARADAAEARTAELLALLRAAGVPPPGGTP